MRGGKESHLSVKRSRVRGGWGLKREMIFATLLLVGIQVMFRGRESVWRGWVECSAPLLSCDLLIYNTARSRHTVIKIKSYSGWSWGGEKAQQGKFVMLGYWVWSLLHLLKFTLAKRNTLKLVKMHNPNKKCIHNSWGSFRIYLVVCACL